MFKSLGNKLTEKHESLDTAGKVVKTARKILKQFIADYADSVQIKYSHRDAELVISGGQGAVATELLLMKGSIKKDILRELPNLKTLEIR